MSDSDKAWLEITTASAFVLAQAPEAKRLADYRLLVIGAICRLDDAAIDRLAMALDSAND